MKKLDLEKKTEDVWKVIRPEVDGTLREAKIPIMRETREATIAGAQLGIRVMSELIEQYLLDENVDPQQFLTLLKMGFGKRKQE